MPPCQDCGAEVDARLAACPSCGGRLDVMTEVGPGLAIVRIVAIVATLLVLASLWWWS